MFQTFLKFKTNMFTLKGMQQNKWCGFRLKWHFGGCLIGALSRPDRAPADRIDCLHSSTGEPGRYEISLTLKQQQNNLSHFW